MAVFVINRDNIDALGIDQEIDNIELDVNNLEGVGAVNDFGSLGRCIGQNKSISELFISSLIIFNPRDEVDEECPLSWIPPGEWEAFFNGVSQSQSIKYIVFRECILGGHVLKLFDIPNLERVEFQMGRSHNCIITRQTASAIRRVPCLREVIIRFPLKYMSDTDEDFIASLNQNCKLEFLFFNVSEITRGEIRALGAILSVPQSRIKGLHLVGFRTDVPLLLLRNSLVNNSSLYELALGLSQMTVEGWEVISDVLSSPVTPIKALGLCASQIDDESAIALANGLTHNTTLEALNLSCFELITAAGWMSMISALGSSNLPLKQIHLMQNAKINDEVVSLLGEVLTAKNDTIEGFSLAGGSTITAIGWGYITAACLTPMPNLEELYLGNPNFSDGALERLSSGLRNKPSLKRMGLFFENVTTGWEALSMALCDNSSLDDIRESNHTLQEIKVDSSVSLPSNIKKLLKLNRSGTPHEVACLKIIEYSEKITIESLVNDQPTMQLKLIPSVISKLANNGDNHNALYQFVRNQSYLFQEAGGNVSAD